MSSCILAVPVMIDVHVHIQNVCIHLLCTNACHHSSETLLYMQLCIHSSITAMPSGVYVHATVVVFNRAVNSHRSFRSCVSCNKPTVISEETRDEV